MDVDAWGIYLYANKAKYVLSSHKQPPKLGILGGHSQEVWLCLEPLVSDQLL